MLAYIAQQLPIFKDQPFPIGAKKCIVKDLVPHQLSEQREKLPCTNSTSWGDFWAGISVPTCVTDAALEA